MTDLANYKAVWRKPIRTNYRGHEIISAPPPASAGVFTAEVLNILEGVENKAGIPFTEFGFGSADHLHFVTEASKIALADRMRYLADPDFVADIPVQKLSVIDAAGNAVSMTLSLNSLFGSGVIAPGTGFLLNNHLMDFGRRMRLGLRRTRRRARR